MSNLISTLLSFKSNTIEENLCNLAFIESPSATTIVDTNGIILHINKTFTSLTGYSQSESIGQNMSFLKSNEHNNLFYKTLWEKFLSQQSTSFDIWNICKDGSKKLFNEKTNLLKLANESFFIVTLEDITEKNKLAQRNKYLATHDPLTGLANRTLLLDRFNHAMLHAKRNKTHLTLIMCDLVEFKKINDMNGHNFGDNVLQIVAEKLRSIIRECDTVARYGGDEFVIILEDIEQEQEIDTILEQLRSNFPLQTQIEKKSIAVNISLGHSSFPNDGNTFTDLLVVADTNMYNNKRKTS